MIKGVSSVVGESPSLDPDVQLMLQVREGDETSFRIATHLALNWLRDEKRERSQDRLDEPPRGSKDGGDDLPARQVADRGPTTEERMLYDARLQEVRDAVAALPEKQRAAVLMHKY